MLLELKKNATIAVALKSLSNFWRSLEMPLINCKVESKLNGKSIVLCLQREMIMIMLIIFFYFLLFFKYTKLHVPVLTCFSTLSGVLRKI